ncbi:MAG: non-canonical purine NTP diphosphatase [Bacteroidota bacterium]
MKLVFATHNLNKLKEVQELLPDSIELLSLSDIGCHEDIAETETTIEGNAQLKANYVMSNYGYACFADDTGLEVTALDGAPGVYSARYAGPVNDASANMAKLLHNLNGVEDRSAQFKTVISLSMASEVKLFTGICEGQILSEKKGEQGFGYDPIFLPTGYTETFAQMNSEEKGKISHRGIAIRALVAYLEHV